MEANCITEAQLEAGIRRVTYARMAALISLVAATPPHSPGNLASGWYIDEIYRDDGSHYHGGRRHKLATSAQMQMTGDTVRVSLNYEIQEA